MTNNFDKKNVSYYNWLRADVLKTVPTDRTFTSVLELGCGEGYTLEFLKENYNVVQTTGIELDTVAANNAKQRVDYIINQSADEPLNLSPQSYDLILCLDVLEHLYDPWSVLNQLAVSLKPDGMLVASIPNVQHWSIFKQLIAGNWNYTKTGLMDETHIRFFTKKTVRALFENAGLAVLRLEGQMGPEVKVLDLLTLKLLNGFFSYRYFVTAMH